MNEEDIIARARQEIASRQHERATQRMGRVWVSAAIAMAIIGAFLLAPGALSNKLLLAMGGVCGLRPGHSYFAGATQLPLESRMVGIYGGLFLTFLVLLWRGRFGARGLGTRPVIVLVALMFFSMVFDGVNSTLAEFQLPHLYQPANSLRLITGLLSGIALGTLLLWLLNVVATPRTAPRRAVLTSPRDLGLPLVVNGMFALLVVAERALLYAPIAIISVGGVVLGLTVIWLLIVVSGSVREERVSRLGDTAVPGVMALDLALISIALLAALRWSATGAG